MDTTEIKSKYQELNQEQKTELLNKLLINSSTTSWSKLRKFQTDKIIAYFSNNETIQEVPESELTTQNNTNTQSTSVFDKVYTVTDVFRFISISSLFCIFSFFNLILNYYLFKDALNSIITYKDIFNPVLIAKLALSNLLSIIFVVIIAHIVMFILFLIKESSK